MTMYDFRARSDAAAIYNNEPSRTKQDFKAQCDINNILKKYVKNGVNAFCITKDAKYGDFTSVPSYQEALELVISADVHFMTLPASVRTRFQNDPAQFLSFIQDDKNLDEARSLGLLEPKVLDQEISLSQASLEALAGMTNPKS